MKPRKLVAVGVDRAVRKHQSALLAAANLRIDVAKKKFGCLLGISDLARTAQEVPGDLQRSFDEDREWFAHMSKTTCNPFGSSGDGCQASTKKKRLPKRAVSSVGDFNDDQSMISTMRWVPGSTNTVRSLTTV